MDGNQVILSTHSPLLAALPGATLFEVGEWGLRRSSWEDTDLVRLWRGFLAPRSASSATSDAREVRALLGWRSMVQLITEADDAVVEAVYRAAFADEPGGPNARFLADELHVHRDRAGFRFVGAVDDGALVGFVYGYTGQRGEWWSDRVARHAPAELVDTWIGGHFEVVELAVAPAARGGGVGAALMTALLEDRPEPCALLTTWQDAGPARRLYERLGWIELLHDLDGSSLYGRLLR